MDLVFFTIYIVISAVMMIFQLFVYWKVTELEDCCRGPQVGWNELVHSPKDKPPSVQKIKRKNRIIYKSEADLVKSEIEKQQKK